MGGKGLMRLLKETCFLGATHHRSRLIFDWRAIQMLDTPLIQISYVDARYMLFACVFDVEVLGKSSQQLNQDFPKTDTVLGSINSLNKSFACQCNVASFCNVLIYTIYSPVDVPLLYVVWLWICKIPLLTTVTVTECCVRRLLGENVCCEECRVQLGPRKKYI